MSGLASLIAVIGAGMGGYATGKKMYDDQERQKRLDAQQEEEYSHKKDLRAKERKLDREVAQASQDVTIGTVTDDGKTYTDPDLISADNRENRVAARRIAETTGQPAIEPAMPSVTGYSVGSQTFADQAGARQAMMGINSEAAKAERLAQVYRTANKPDEAKKHLDAMKQAITEGSDKILLSIQSAAPSVDALKKTGGAVVGTVGQEAADIFNRTGGKWKVSPDTKVEYYIAKDPAGREFANARVLGADGKPVVEDVKNMGLMLADMKTRLEAQKNDMTVFQKGTEIAEVGRHNQAAEKTAARSADASMVSAQASATNAATHAQSLALQQDQFKKQSLQGQLDQLEAVTGPLKPEDRKALGLQLAGLGKDNQAYSKFVDGVVMKGIEAGTVKAEDATKVRDRLLQSKAVGDQEAIIASDLASSANDPVSYAEKYQKALKITPAGRLVEMGYKPPVPPKPGPGAVNASKGASLTQYAAPPNSPAGKHQARILNFQAQQAEQTRQAQESFSTDVQALTPIDLSRKYDAVRGLLSGDQKLQLFNAERNIR